MGRFSTTSLADMKKDGRRIVAITAYDYFTARFIDDTVDVILVGDSVGMVLYGYKTTHRVTLDMMLAHTNAVGRAARRALVVADMPFLSYEPSERDAVLSAGALIRAGAQAVKLEGGLEMESAIRAIVNAGIPVMGHLGMLPQSIYRVGGYRRIGEDIKERSYILQSIKMMEDAGVFAVVLEKTAQEVAAEITENSSIPTIGIGSGADCDGQILVINDILGLFDRFKPSFARRYVDLKGEIIDAVSRYADDVRSGDFPSENEI